MVRELHRTSPVVALGVTGPEDPGELLSYCEELADQVRVLEGVSDTSIFGFSTRQLLVHPSREGLRQHGIGPTALGEALASQSVDLPAGNLETETRYLLVRFRDERRTVRELEELRVLGGAPGAEVRLADLARIESGFEFEEARAFLDGRRAGILQVEACKQQDELDVLDRVVRFVEEEHARAPPAVRLVLIRDVSSIVRSRLVMLVKNGWQGLLLVFLVMGLLFGLRLAFWVSLGLPVSFLGAFFFMAHADLSLNMVSLVALLIALGLLLDDAIVISENIATHLAAERSFLDAAAEGTREVAGGVLASFLTTAAVFVPLSFLAGDMGKVLGVIPVVLVLVLAVSLVAVGLLAGGRLLFVPFPELDGDVFEARLILPSGTPLAGTEEVVSRLVAALERVGARLDPLQPEGERLIRHVTVQYDTNATVGSRGANLAPLTVDLLSEERRRGKLDEIYQLLQEELGEVPDVEALELRQPSFGPAGIPSRATDRRGGSGGARAGLPGAPGLAPGIPGDPEPPGRPAAREARAPPEAPSRRPLLGNRRAPTRRRTQERAPGGRDLRVPVPRRGLRGAGASRKEGSRQDRGPP